MKNHTQPDTPLATHANDAVSISLAFPIRLTNGRVFTDCVFALGVEY
jgi:hypothetical protein